jgi:hypothetical protein
MELAGPDAIIMPEQLRASLEAAARQLRQVIGECAMLLGRVLLAAWDVVRPVIVLALNIIAALILLFEEWGWQPLSALLARLARFPLWAMVERGIAGLPPYGALLTLTVPSVILVPAKLLGVYLLATGHFVTAGALIIAAKVASTALIARIFLLTKPALMQIPWFAYAYGVVVPWQEALFARIRSSWVWRYGRVLKWRAKQYVRSVWTAARPRIEARWRDIAPRLREVGFRLRTIRFRAQLVVRDLWARISPPARTEPRQLPPPDGRR